MTATIASCASRPPYSSIVFGNTITSIAASRSSSTKVAINSPRRGVTASQRCDDSSGRDAHHLLANGLRVEATDRRGSVGARGRRIEESRIVTSVALRRACSTPMSGWSLT